MSNLLKKDRGADVATFGFPDIERDGRDGKSLPVPDENNEPAEPEVSSEELFRKKLLELERRTQEIEKEAYGKGFAQGEKDGLEYGNKSVQVVKSQLERIVENMEALPGKIFQDYRHWLIDTSIRIARRIVNREIQTSPEIVAGIASSLLDEAEEHTTLTVYLNPTDIEFIEKRTDLAISANRKLFTVKADRNLERGSCRVESAVQLLDASIDHQFENLEEYLLGAAPESAGENDG